MPRMTSTSVIVVKAISWHWPSTLSHCNVSGFDSPFTSMGTLPTPTTIVLDFFKDPRWDFHFWYHPHLQQDIVAPVSTRAATSTLAMVTLTTISWDALSDTGATNVLIWLLWHPLALSGTLWHLLALSGAILFFNFLGRVASFRAARSLFTVGHCINMWPLPQHQHLNLPLTAFPGRSFLLLKLAWACSCLRHSPTTCSRSTLFSLGFSSSLLTVKTFPFSRSSLSCTFCRNLASSRASRTHWKCFRLNSRPMLSGNTFRKALSPSLACISTSSVALAAFAIISAAIPHKNISLGWYLK